MTNKLPFMPLYVYDLLTDEAFKNLTNTQAGVFLKLLCYQWIEGDLPTEPMHICKLADVDLSEYNEIWPALSGLFPVSADDDNRLKNKKLDKVRRDQERIYIAKSRGGKRQKQESSTIHNHNHNHNKPPKAPLWRSVNMPDDLDTDKFKSAWSEWNAARSKSYKRPQQQIDRLSSWGHDRAVAAIRYSLAQGYQGIYEERSNGRTAETNLARIKSTPEKLVQYDAKTITLGKVRPEAD